MAGDWIKMEVSTPDKAEVLAIAAHMGWDDPDLAVGKLFRVWRWFDQHTVDGNARGVTRTLFDRIAGVPRFSEAMESVGWLVVDSAGIRLPGFEKHCGRTAKDRAQTARRVATHRSNAFGNGHGVTETDTPSLAREEKRREEVNAVSVDTATEKKSGRQSVGIRELVGAGGCRQHAADWLKVREKPLTVTAWNRVVAEAGKAGITPAEAVRIAAENSWRGFKADWLSRVGGGAESTYTPAQAAVFEAYNSVLGAKEWPAASVEPFSPERAAAISQFLTFNDKPDFARRYFDYLAENLQARPGYGLDWTLRRDIYLRAREANFSIGASNVK